MSSKIFTPDQKAAKAAKRKARREAKKGNVATVAMVIARHTPVAASAANFQFIGSTVLQPTDYERVGHLIVFTVPCGDDDYDTEIDCELNDDVVTEFGSADAFYDAATEASPAVRNEYSCKCNVCNSNVKRMVYFRNIYTRTYIVTGLDCAHSVLKYRMDVAGAKKQTLAAKRKRDTVNKCTAILEANTGLEEALNVNDRKIREISSNFYRYGKLSEKQINFIHMLAKKRVSFEAASTPAIAGKITDEQYTILSVKNVGLEDEERYQVLLSHNNGHKLLYTGGARSLQTLIHKTQHANSEHIQKLNGSIYKMSTFYRHALPYMIGMTVEVSGTINVSKDDQFFGFLKTGKFYELAGETFTSRAATIEANINSKHNEAINFTIAAITKEWSDTVEALKDITPLDTMVTIINGYERRIAQQKALLR